MPRLRLSPVVRRALAAAGTAAVLNAAPLAGAQTSDPEALALVVARELLVASDARNALIGELASPDFAREHGLDLTPGWRLRLRAAAAEEYDDSLPELEQQAGRALAMTFTQQELQAISAFLRSPAGQSLVQYLAGTASGVPVPAPTGQARDEIDRFLRTPEGRALREELEDPGPHLEGLDGQAMEALSDGVVRRYREKTAAGGGGAAQKPEAMIS